MSDIRVTIGASGVITLGPDIACDGFHRDYLARVQSHLHSDHMHGFDTSKGLQDIYLTRATRDLLIDEFNADLNIRTNLIALDYEDKRSIGSSCLMLLPAGHMLGSAQVCVELADGLRVGYSGDFQWPLEKVISVDQLVLDSTYGAPTSVRQYTQAEAEHALLKIVFQKLTAGPVHIKAHRGTLHRALQVLSEVESCQLLGSPALCAQAEVFRAFGYPIGSLRSFSSQEGISAIKEGRYIRFYGVRDQFPIELKTGTCITLSAFMTNFRNPVLEYSDRALRIALTDHADFDGTIEYVKATGAKYVLTDNSRGGHPIELAQEIKRRLNIDSAPAELILSHEWGV